MPLVETLPVGAGCAQWPVWSTLARVVVAEPRRLDDAVRIIRDELAAIDHACSRFRSDSEIQHVHRAAGRSVTVSARLAELIRCALDAAAATDGDVDPTIGASLAALGYDRDFDAIGSPVAISIEPAPGWRCVRIDGRNVTLPAGVRLDLGATAKAFAADRCAALVALQCDTGVLVSVGGDIATAGPAPDDRIGHGYGHGWGVRVQDGHGEPACTVTLPAGAAIATSSTIARTWRSGARKLHHILEPRTGEPARAVWRTASVAARTCVDANTLATAALVRGTRARQWLGSLGAPARLVAADGDVVTVGGWPVEPVGRAA